MDETTEKIKDAIYLKVEDDVKNSDDAWMHNEYLSLYLQLKILDELDRLWKKLDNVQCAINTTLWG